MENICKILNYKVSKDKTLECEYCFDYVDTNRDSSNIDLVIRLNDTDRNVNYLKISVNKNILDRNTEEIESLVKAELESYYNN